MLTQKTVAIPAYASLNECTRKVTSVWPHYVSQTMSTFSQIYVVVINPDYLLIIQYVHVWRPDGEAVGLYTGGWHLR